MPSPDKPKQNILPQPPAGQPTVDELTVASPMHQTRDTADGNQHEGEETIDLGDADPQRQTGGAAPRASFGEYELIEEIARGGMGVVYKARQRTLNRIVALKMIVSGQLAGEDEILRFRTEAEAAAGLDHPGIVPIYEVGQTDGQHFFSMGFVDGQSLSQRIAESPLNSRDAAEMLLGITEAVEYAHQQGIVHRDLKPSNVLLKGHSGATAGSIGASVPRESSSAMSGSPQAASSEGASLDRGSRGSTARNAEQTNSPSSRAAGRSVRPMITDFGLAKRLESDSSMTASGQILGTPSYMPPEQAAGQTENIDARSDVYSIGATLYCMLTGRPPFRAASLVETIRHVIELDPVSPRQINPEISRDLETICLKCLEKEPNRRYPTAQAVADDLRAFLDGRPVNSRPVGLLGKLTRWAKRKPVVASLSATVALLAIGGVAGIVWQWRVAQANFVQSQAYLRTAQANHRRAVAERERADEQRSQAEISFDLARDTVQRFLTIVPNHELVNEPGMEPVKEQLQTLGRDYYLTLAEARPDDFDVTSGLAQSHFFLAMTLEDVGKLAEAAAEYGKAAPLFQIVADRAPDSSANQRNLAACYGNLANVQINLGQRAAGIATYRRIGKMQQALVDQHPDDSISRLHLAMTYLNLSLLELDDGQVDAAMTSASTATEMARQLQLGHADDMQIQFMLAKALSTTGRLHWERQNLEAAISDYDAAVVAYRLLLTTGPGDPELNAELSGVYNDIAMIRMEQGNQPASAEHWELTFAHARAAHTAAPQVQLFRENLSIKLRNGAQFYRSNGQFDKALELLTDARRLRSDDVDTLYKTAADVAGMLTLLDNQQDTLPSETLARRDHVEALALQWLSEAIEQGFDDAATLESDAWLDPLREKPAFIKLLQELQQASRPQEEEGEVPQPSSD